MQIRLSTIQRLSLICLGLILAVACSSKQSVQAQEDLRMGVERMDLLLPMLEGKRVALMVNQSSVVGEAQTHLLDTLLSRGIDIKKIFVPEHGFRGNVDAGKFVRSDIDSKTGLPIVSLYAQRKRPTAEMLRDIDVILFDIQDVGVRFYTYISSMHYLMDAAAEYNKEVIVADRPNPNDFVDGPILEADCKSFVGIHPIPIAHGLTVAELAQMINGERWLANAQRQCKLQVLPMQGWKHGDTYSLPIAPSPNLQTDRAIELYPSICIFEASIMSVGRGTDLPFTSLSYPHKAFGKALYRPEVRRGSDMNPRHKGRLCYGLDLRTENYEGGKINLEWLVKYYAIAKKQGLELINQNQLFSLLIGNKRILPMLRRGLSAEEIRSSWLPELENYKHKRKQYLLYPDYEE